MKMPPDVLDIFEKERVHQIATVSPEGIPNISNAGAKYVRANGDIVIIDNYMKKTYSNIISNPNVSILVRREGESYQIKGICRYVNTGEEYEEARNWMKAIADKYPAKGALIITITDIFYSMSGAKAGTKLA